MKMIKRLLSVWMSVLLLIGLVPLAALPVSAQVNATPLAFGSPVTVTLSVGESKWYSFTPETTKTYAFVSSDEIDVDPMASLFNSSMERIADGDDSEGSNFVITATLTAGQTYYLEAYEYGLNDEGYYTLTVDVPLPTDVFLDHYSLTRFAGTECVLGVHVYPEDSDDTLTWTSSDESVATVDADGTAHCLAAGTTTVEVQTVNGLADSCIIEVKAVEGGLTLGAEKEIAHTEPKEERAETQRYHAFTPDETGYYRLYSYDIVTTTTDDATIDPRVWVYSGEYDELAYDDDDGEGVNFRVEVALEAGETYYFRTELYDPAATGSFNVMIEKMITADAVSIDCGDLTMDQGDFMDIFVTYSPADCWQEDYVVTSSDPDVVKVQYKTIMAVGEGEATVTVTSDLGLTDSIAVTVIGADELELDTVYTLEGSPDTNGGKKRYVFTPAVAGRYTITSVAVAGEDATVAVGLNEELNDLRHNDTESDSFSLTYELEANKMYYYTVLIWCEQDSSVEFKLTAENDDDIPKADIFTDYAVTVDNPGDGAYYVFKPVASGCYAIFSEPGEEELDTKLYVYNSDWELFYSNDDGGDGSQFRLVEEFTAGETYYLKSYLYDDCDVGAFIMRIEPQFEVEGDTNGDYKVNLVDAFAVYAVAAGRGSAEDLPECADMNRDGSINLADAYAVYRIASGLSYALSGANLMIL